MSDENDIYTIGMALFWAENALRDSGITTPELDAEILLADITGLSKEELFFDQTVILDQKLYFDYERIIARRKNGEPVAYLTGHKEFYGIDLKVDNSVLVPRPETEELVDRALDYAKEFNGQAFSMLDVGTGSGAIVLACTKSINDWVEKYNFSAGKFDFWAIDSSVSALNTARKNATQLELLDKINFVQSDLLTKINLKKVDLLVANLPYLDRERIKEYSPEILQEPKEALFADNNGLNCYERLFYQIKKNNIQIKKIVIECGEEQEEHLKRCYPGLEVVTV